MYFGPAAVDHLAPSLEANRVKRAVFGFVDWRSLNVRAQSLLDRLGVSIDTTASLGSLSAAEQRMVMIARALAWDAKLLVLDEPTASLTDNEIAHLFTVSPRHDSDRSVGNNDQRPPATSAGDSPQKQLA